MEQKTLALNYVKDYVFGFCPISIESVKQNGRMNELITLSRVSLEEQRKHHLIGFPDTAVVEYDGTIVIRKGETQTTTITPEMLIASRSALPPKPQSPRELSVENAELVKSLNWMRDNSVDNILFETFSVTRPGSSNEIVRGRCSRL